jgi:hypothetical protein
MYANINFQTKKALKEAVAAGKAVTVYQPGPFGGNPPQNQRREDCEGFLITAAATGRNKKLSIWF